MLLVSGSRPLVHWKPRRYLPNTPGRVVSGYQAAEDDFIGESFCAWLYRQGTQDHDRLGMKTQDIPENEHIQPTAPDMNTLLNTAVDLSHLVNNPVCLASQIPLVHVCEHQDLRAPDTGMPVMVTLITDDVLKISYALSTAPFISV
ncbi:hypothetical protein STEG23_004804 [Scotinomys teguina]